MNLCADVCGRRVPPCYKLRVICVLTFLSGGYLASDSGGSFGYDTAGDLTAQPGDTQAFNADGQLTSTTAPAASYSYNADGDLTKAGSTALGYNQANQLTSYGSTRSYVYNGDGLRMSKTVAGTTTAFAWDQSGSTALLIAAGADYYMYGPDGQPIEQLKGTTPTYLLTDQSGSVRLLTGSSGTVTGTYAYTPYGAVAAHTGTATAALGYEGQYTDAESGFLYLQARYYNPATGQFLTRDPLVSVTGEPYSYAADNPVNDSDPNGLCPCDGAQAARLRLLSFEVNLVSIPATLLFPASRLVGWFFPSASTLLDLGASASQPGGEGPDYVGFGADGVGLGAAAAGSAPLGVGASGVSLLNELSQLGDDASLVWDCSWDEQPLMPDSRPLGGGLYYDDPSDYVGGNQ